MSTVVTRKFAASPVHPAAEVWTAMIKAIANDNDQIKAELNSVVGIAASIIAERTPASFPITIIGSGSRLRLYCLYDDDAVSEDIHEDPISWNLFESDWRVHFPAAKSDLDWINKILEEKGSHFVAYLTGEKIKGDEDTSGSTPAQLTINPERLKGNG